MSVFRIIYDPVVINDNIGVVYTTTTEMIGHGAIHDIVQFSYYPDPYQSMIPYIDGSKRNQLFQLKYKPKRNMWYFFHANLDLFNDNRIARTIKYYLHRMEGYRCLNKKHKYLGLITEDYNIIVINTIVDDGNNYLHDDYPSKLDLTNGIIHYNIDDQIKTEKFRAHDIILATENGFVCVNPVSHIDMIFSIIRNSQCKDKIKELTNSILCNSFAGVLPNPFTQIGKILEHIEKLEPKSEYGQIFSMYSIHDHEYHENKFTEFKDNVVRIFRQSNEAFSQWSMDKISCFITEFIGTFKMDFVRELCVIYHRMKHFPEERKIIYATYPDHPYIKLLKKIHYYSSSRSITQVNDSIICDMIQEHIHFATSDNLTAIIIGAITQRSELFVHMYNLYLESLTDESMVLEHHPNGTDHDQIKHKISYNYFPFKVFSSAIFIMDHLLSCPADF